VSKGTSSVCSDYICIYIHTHTSTQGQQQRLQRDERAIEIATRACEACPHTQQHMLMCIESKGPASVCLYICLPVCVCVCVSFCFFLYFCLSVCWLTGTSSACRSSCAECTALQREHLAPGRDASRSISVASHACSVTATAALLRIMMRPALHTICLS
jgi:hypothetical protein